MRSTDTSVYETTEIPFGWGERHGAGRHNQEPKAQLWHLKRVLDPNLQMLIILQF